MPTRKPFGGASNNRFEETFRAGVDLTANMYRCVQLWPSQTVTAGTATANTVSTMIIGIQGAEVPDSGTNASIRVIMGGVTQARAGAAFSAGVLLMAQTNTSKVIEYTSATSAAVIGRALESASADSEIVAILVIPSGVVL